MRKPSFYEKYIKRLLDIVFSLTGIIILSPVFIITALLVRIKLGSPVIFTQVRPGKDEKLFKMYKFRTMTDKRDEKGELLPDSDRLTPFGKKLRSTSLDELPELFNILKGEMSIVGPRPQLVKDMVFMNEEQRKRHTVRPGLTGWAQVNGRNNITWEEKLDFDLEYLENQTLIVDTKVILMTLVAVFKREGIATFGMDTSYDYGDYLKENNLICKNKYVRLLNESNRLVKEWKDDKI